MGVCVRVYVTAPLHELDHDGATFLRRPQAVSEPPHPGFVYVHTMFMCVCVRLFVFVCVCVCVGVCV